MSNIVPRNEGNVVPLSRLQQELVEATAERSLPRLQRVIGAATVAAEAQHRVARLASGEGSPQEVVKAATDAANDAGGVRLAAEAECGRILREMAESGERKDHGGDRKSNQQKPGLIDLVGEEREDERRRNARQRAFDRASRWQKVGDIPDNVRVEYIDAVKEKGGEVTQAGLLRYAAPKDEQPTADQPDGLEAAYDDAVRIVGKLLRYDSKALAAHASNTKRRTQYRKLMERLREWVDQTDPILT